MKDLSLSSRSDHIWTCCDLCKGYWILTRPWLICIQDTACDLTDGLELFLRPVSKTAVYMKSEVILPNDPYNVFRVTGQS